MPVAEREDRTRDDARSHYRGVRQADTSCKVTLVLVPKGG